MIVRDYLNSIVGWIIVIGCIGLLTQSAIDEHKILCNKMRVDLDKQHSDWQSDLNELPKYGYNIRLDSSVTYHQSLNVYNRQCKDQ